MIPIRYVELLKDYYESQGFPPFKWSVFDDAPWTALEKPLSDCRVSLITSSGLSCCGQEPFDPNARNDLRVYPIPLDAPKSTFEVNDNYYDHRSIQKDVNTMMPIDRLKELAEEGFIADVAPRIWSGFMGRIYKRTQLMEEAVPAFADELKKDGVDLLVLVPACPLDQQTSCLVARGIEEAGIVTVVLATARDIAAQTKPPRAAFINFPMGNAFGRAGDAETQRAVLNDTLRLAETATEPGTLVDLDYDWGEPFDFFETLNALLRQEGARRIDQSVE